MSEQESGTHGAREDDALEKEFRSEREARRWTRGEDWREPDMPDEDEPEADRALAGSLGARLAGVEDWDAIELRSDLARHLDRTAFPGTRDHLAEVLAGHQAQQQLQDLIASLPPDARFSSLAELLTALGLPVEH
jgi:hypothetical protein